MDPTMQIREPGLEVRLVVLPPHAIHARRGFAFERIKRQPERINVDVVEERGEPRLLSKPCSLPHAVQRLGHASPGLSPVRALLVRVPLVPALGSIVSAAGEPALFDDFAATMAESDFSWPFIGGYGSSPSRRGPPPR